MRKLNIYMHIVVVYIYDSVFLRGTFLAVYWSQITYYIGKDF